MGKSEGLLFPNPARDEIRLGFDLDKNTPFQILDAVGKCLLTGNLQAGQTEIPVHTLPTGVYILRLDGEGGYRFVKE